VFADFALSLPPLWFDPAVFLINLAWVLIRSSITFIMCFFLGLAGLKILDRLTPGITEMRNIKRTPLSIALYALGMFIFLSLTFVGSVAAPLPIGVSSGLGATVGPLLVLGYRLVALLAGFIIAMVFAGIVYRMLSKEGLLGIDLNDVNKDPVATSLYVVGYLIFLGAILYATLLIPV
jgi:hypothetical protein